MSCFMLALLLTSCGDDVKQSPPNTLILGHRGTGSGVRDGYLENTPAAVREALKYADGVEQDIQMSADGTLWVFHDGAFEHLCEPAYHGDTEWACIPTTPDSVIAELRICRDGVEERIYRLEELFELMQSYPDKVLSLDVKGYFDERCIPGGNVWNEYLEEAAHGLADGLKRYDMTQRVFVETDYVPVFAVLKASDPEIRCHLLGYGDLSEKTARVVGNGWDGVSFRLSDTSLTDANVRNLKEAGLGLQLWTVSNMEEYQYADSFRPTTLQVGGVDLLRAIREKRKKRGD